MKSVMFVDDEILVRETVKACIKWENEGFRFAGDAPDGEIALQLLEQLQPDILITDIMMPFMDGLELSEIVRKRMPEVKIIILSGHEEFEYARKALRLGVEEYCLKPVSAASLLELLHSVSRKIDEERQHRESLRKQLLNEHEVKTMTKEKLLSDLCSGFLTASEAVHWSSTLSLDLLSSHYAVVVSDDRGAAWEDQEEALGLLHTCNAATVSVLPSDCEQLVYKRSRSETVWIVKGDSAEQIEERLKRYRMMREQPDSVAGAAISIGIGSVHDRLQGIHLSYLDAEEDMHWQRLSRQNRNELRASGQVPLDPATYLDRSKYMEFLRLGIPSEAGQFITTYMAEFIRLDWENTPIGHYVLSDLTFEVLQSSEQSFRISLKEALPQFQAQISRIRTADEASAYLIRLAEQYWRWRAEGSDKYGELIVRLKAYIEEHYDKEYISLQSASEYVRLSPSHLSKVFSQETGQTFIEYLTQTRIQKAMELLLTTPAKSYEIAFQVGYNDSHYFSNLFKRVTGMTTKQFRKNGGLPLATKDEQNAAVRVHG